VKFFWKNMPWTNKTNLLMQKHRISKVRPLTILNRRSQNPFSRFLNFTATNPGILELERLKVQYVEEWNCCRKTKSILFLIFFLLSDPNKIAYLSVCVCNCWTPEPSGGASCINILHSCILQENFSQDLEA
jgi:hypothetical protein